MNQRPQELQLATFVLLALPLREAAALVMQADVPAGEPPPDGSPHGGALAPAVGIAAARAVARIVELLQEAASHGPESLRLGVALAVGGAPEDPAEDADDRERHDGRSQDDQVERGRARARKQHPHSPSLCRNEKARAAARAFSEGVGGYGEHVIALKAAAPHGATPNSVDKSIAPLSRMTYPR